MLASFRRVRWVVLVCLGLALLVGCDKEYKLTFFNSTDQSRDVILAGPGDGTGYLGSVGPMSKLKTKIKVDEDWLPATYHWEADDIEDSFTLDDDSKSPLMIVIEPGGALGPIDENTEIQKSEKLEAEDMIIEQDTVVE